jgi:hypothetical protein
VPPICQPGTPRVLSKITKASVLQPFDCTASAASTNLLLFKIGAFFYAKTIIFCDNLSLKTVFYQFSTRVYKNNNDLILLCQVCANCPNRADGTWHNRPYRTTIKTINFAG